MPYMDTTYILCALIAAALGYLFGSFNGAIVTVRLLRHEDIRKFGSGNAGLTNVLRCFGKPCGILTLVLDLGKGALTIALTQLFCGLLNPTPLLAGGISVPPCREFSYLAAVFVVLGHVFPIWHGFRGGKGVLVGVSVFLVLNPLAFVLLMSVFGLMLWRTKYVSLSSITATAAVVPVTFLLERFQRHESWGYVIIYTALIAVTAFIIIWSHRENIHRLREGTERRIGDKKPDPEAKGAARQ